MMGTNLLIHIPSHKEDLAYTFYLVDLTPDDLETKINLTLQGNKKNVSLGIKTDSGIKYILPKRLLEESVLVLKEWDEHDTESFQKQGGYMVTIDGVLTPLEPFSANVFNKNKDDAGSKEKGDKQDGNKNDWE